MYPYPPQLFTGGSANINAGPVLDCAFVSAECFPWKAMPPPWERPEA